MRYFIHLAYSGKKYRGWQRQKTAKSVQAVLEDKLSLMLHRTVTCHCCGRTDAGVHASQFFAHIDIPETLDYDPVFRINKMLPVDIAVYDFIKVPDRANAQLDAQQRTYQYFFHQVKNPFLSEFSAYYEKDLDLKKMQDACALILKNKDFQRFCITPEMHNHTFCEVSEASIVFDESTKRWCFTFTANRFLRAMVRITVGRLIDVGSGKISLQQLENALVKFEPIQYNTQAHPHGLQLCKITYPFLDVPNQSVAFKSLNQAFKSLP